MIAKAIQHNIRVSAKKASLVCALIRNQKINNAFKILANTPQKTAHFLHKLLASAVANAINNHSMNGTDLYVFSAVANQGPTYKRTIFQAKGRTNIIRKRSVHLEIIVSDNINEKHELNKKLLKPRAHQFKFNLNQNVDKPIHVETKVIDHKGVTK